MQHLSVACDSNELRTPLLQSRRENDFQVMQPNQWALTFNENVQQQVQRNITDNDIPSGDFEFESSSKMDPADYTISYDESFRDEFFKTQVSARKCSCLLVPDAFHY